MSKKKQKQKPQKPAKPLDRTSASLRRVLAGVGLVLADPEYAVKHEREAVRAALAGHPGK